MTLFNYIKSKNFFPTYAPTVKQPFAKIQGRDWRGKTIAFTQEDKKAIKEGLKRMVREEKV
jgi:hypothetical protein